MGENQSDQHLGTSYKAGLSSLKETSMSWKIEKHGEIDIKTTKCGAQLLIAS